jgi:rRNA-processing protein FCF1
MLKFLLDTNVLLYAFQKEFDIKSAIDSSVSEAYSLHTLDVCVEELAKTGKHRIDTWLKGLNIFVLASENAGSVDDTIIKTAKGDGFCILTEDRALAAKALSLGIPIAKKSLRGIKLEIPKIR